jgi:hypothetical protein
VSENSYSHTVSVAQSQRNFIFSLIIIVDTSHPFANLVLVSLDMRITRLFHTHSLIAKSTATALVPIRQFQYCPTVGNSSLSRTFCSISEQSMKNTICSSRIRL